MSIVLLINFNWQLLLLLKITLTLLNFFYVVSNLVTVVGGSCKRWDALQDAQFAKIKEDLENGACSSEQDLNQETFLNALVIHVGDYVMRLFSTWFWCSLLLLMYLRLLKNMTPTKKLKLNLLWGQFYLLNLSLLYIWRQL